MFPKNTDFEAQVSLEKESSPIPEDPPFHILFLGDYSGRENLSSFVNASLTEPKPFEIDRDNFEDVMKKLNVSLRLDLQGDGKDLLLLNFKELDDFHPDQIFQQLSIFSELREIRKRLLNHDTFESAARDVRSWFEEADSEKEIVEEKSENSSENVSESSGNLLDDILGQTKADASSYKTQATDNIELNEFIKDIVRPHIIHTDEAEQAKLLAVVDDATSELMRKILHHPQFQALESAWRGLYFVVRRTETSNDLKLFLYDISKDELVSELKTAGDLSETTLYKKLILEKMETLGGESWALICGNYTFELNVEDVATLIRLAKLGGVASSPFISSIVPKMLGIESLAESPVKSGWNLTENTNEAKLWTTLRTIDESPNLGLTIPNFLVRLPYGEKTEPTEVFSFEEFTENIEHEKYVWSNASFICATLLAQSFRSYGWEMGQRLFQEVEGLSIHFYEHEGETKTKSSAEIEMTHEACDTLLEQGLIPLISFKNTDRVRIADFKSISFPEKALNGRWS